MNDQNRGIDAQIAEAAHELYHVPPATPGEEMWSVVESRLESESTVVPIDSLAKRRTPGRMGWWIGIAAALAIGLGLGRLTLGPTSLGDTVAESAMRTGSPSVVPRIQKDRVLLDMRTIDPADDTHLAHALVMAHLKAQQTP